MDRWFSFDGITTITNEPGPGIEPHSCKVKWGINVHRKGRERRKVDNYVVDSRIICTGPKTRNIVHIEFLKFFKFIYFFNFFFIFVIASHDQLLTELRIKIKLDKHSYFASRDKGPSNNFKGELMLLH